MNGITAYCIFINTIIDGKIPAWKGDDGEYLLYRTAREAEREIADDVVEKLMQVLDGDRELEDALTREEYVEPVILRPDGTFTDIAGTEYRPGKLLDLQ